MKEKDKILFLESVLKIFFFLFIILFLLRLIGFDYFQFDIENTTVIKLTKALYQGYFGQFITLYLSSFILFQLICQNKNQKHYYYVTFLITILNILTQLLLNNPFINQYYPILNILILLLGIYAIDRRIPIKRTILIFFLNIIYQAISLFIRNINFNNYYNEVYEFLLQIDYLILLIITYLIHKLKANSIPNPQKCFLQTLPNIKYKKIKSKPLTIEQQQERLSNYIYLVLSLIWNFFTLGIIILICTINTTLITTIFLLFSFITTKSTFSEAFHMKRALSCFIVSNLIYFTLSRITVSIHLSFLIPIILGVGLSYISSLFVTSEESPKSEIILYRGMSEEELQKICKEKELNKYETNLLKDFYCKRMTLLQLSVKYNYSKDTIYYHKKKAIKKLKGI